MDETAGSIGGSVGIGVGCCVLQVSSPATPIPLLADQGRGTGAFTLLFTVAVAVAFAVVLSIAVDVATIRGARLVLDMAMAMKGKVNDVVRGHWRSSYPGRGILGFELEQTGAMITYSVGCGAG